MVDVLTVILGGGRGTRLQPLTKLRAKPAVPIAGKFRLIDIPISNCINSGYTKIYVLTQFNSVSLHRHINQTYKFDIFSHGFIELLAAQQTLTSDQWYQGTADAVRQTLPNFRALNMDYILILAGDHLYQMDYSKFIDFHLDSGADISIAVKPVSKEKASDFGILHTDDNDRITAFHEKPKGDALNGLESNTGDPSKPYLASMGIYVFKRGLMHDLLEEHEGDDFGGDIIPYAINKLNVMGYKFNDYWEDIGTIKSFFNANLALTKPFPELDLYQREQPIYSRSRYLPASKVEGGSLTNTMICEGCIVEKSEIGHSIIGIRSKIMPGVRMKNVIMMGADMYQTLAEIETDKKSGIPVIGIGENSVVENAILDRNTRIGENVRLTNEKNVAEGSYDGFEVRDGIIVTYKDAVIRSGTTF